MRGTIKYYRSVAKVACTPVNLIHREALSLK